MNENSNTPNKKERKKERKKEGKKEIDLPLQIT